MGFVGTLRWDPIRKLTIRNRELGAQVEYRLSSRIKLLLAGYQARQKYRLDVPGEVELRDEMMLVGTGFEWKISKYFRLLVEGGVVPSRNLRIKPRGAPPITNEDAENTIDVQRLGDTIAGAVDSCELRRVDLQESALQVVYYVAARDVSEVYRLLDRLRVEYPGASISLLDQHRIPGV